MSFLIKALTTIISKHIVHPAPDLGGSPRGLGPGPPT